MENAVIVPALPTLQEIFDKTALHLLRQNRHSFQAGSTIDCAYRGPDGVMCAVGPWIKDEHYDAETLESRGAEDEVVVEALVKSGVLPPPTQADWDAYECADEESTAFSRRLTLFMELQGIHDYMQPHVWREALINNAAANDLSAEVVENFKGEVTP